MPKFVHYPRGGARYDDLKEHTPKFVHYPRGGVRYDDLKGRVLMIPSGASISWFVVPGAVHDGKIQLRSIPNGTLDEANFDLIRWWVDNGQLIVAR